MSGKDLSEGKGEKGIENNVLLYCRRVKNSGLSKMNSKVHWKYFLDQEIKGKKLFDLDLGRRNIEGHYILFLLLAV